MEHASAATAGATSSQEQAKSKKKSPRKISVADASEATASAPAVAQAQKKVITKAELRKIKIRVAKLRKQGHDDIWTDDEVEKEGYTLGHGTPTGLHVAKKKQEESWDCGVACVQMALGALGHQPSTKDLMSRLASNSVWSIDLAYLLAEYGVECEFLTKVASMDASAYDGNAFYNESIAADSRRVSRLFAAAADEGVVVQERTLSATELWNLMREEDTMAILLVDAAKVHKRVQAGAEEASAASASTGFLGHYVLVTGLDDERGGFVVNDPGRDDERTFVHSTSLEVARMADGTDEDVILIPIYQQPPQPPPADSPPKIVRVCEAGVSELR